MGTKCAFSFQNIKKGLSIWIKISFYSCTWRNIKLFKEYWEEVLLTPRSLHFWLIFLIVINSQSISCKNFHDPGLQLNFSSFAGVLEQRLYHDAVALLMQFLAFPTTRCLLSSSTWIACPATIEGVLCRSVQLKLWKVSSSIFAKKLHSLSYSYSCSSYPSIVWHACKCLLSKLTSSNLSHLMLVGLIWHCSDPLIESLSTNGFIGLCIVLQLTLSYYRSNPRKELGTFPRIL